MRKLKVHLKKKSAIILATVLGCVLLCLLTIYLFTPKIKIDGGNDVETVEYMSEYQVSPAEAYRFGQKLKRRSYSPRNGRYQNAWNVLFNLSLWRRSIRKQSNQKSSCERYDGTSHYINGK